MPDPEIHNSQHEIYDSFLNVALDAMGGDFGVEPLIQGALNARRRLGNLRLLLTGVPGDIENALDRLDRKWRAWPIKIIASSQAVGMGEGVMAIGRKRHDSSIAKCLELVKTGQAHAAVSAGSTSASVYWAIETLGTFPTEDLKPAVPIPWPHSNGFSLVIDAGATPDADAAHLAHFAVLGSLYAKAILKRDSVRVGLLSIGEERTKGNSRIKEAYRLIETAIGKDFAGMIEGRDVPLGKVDVVVCDAFMGNVMLKLGEGFIEEAGRMLKKNLNWIGKLGGLLMLPSLKKIKKRFSWENVGGAPLLGVRGNLIIAHGRSSA
ncbi:MAG: phosphate acyltransferase PlsX, partial [Elusimicrobiota bacterium]